MVQLSQTLLRVALVAAVLPATASAAWAGIASTSGKVVVQAAPSGTFAEGSLEDNGKIYVWFEKTVSNTGSLTFDHVGAGTVNSSGSANPATVDPGGGESYLIHYDHNGTGNGSKNVKDQTITFTAPIVGLWFTQSGLAGSDSMWQPAGLTYSDPSNRGLELGTSNSTDRFSISSDGLTLTILRVASGGTDYDQLRVVINPEPGSASLAGLGVLGLGTLVGIRRRRRVSPLA